MSDPCERISADAHRALKLGWLRPWHTGRFEPISSLVIAGGLDDGERVVIEVWYRLNARTYRFWKAEVRWPGHGTTTKIKTQKRFYELLTAYAPKGS